MNKELIDKIITYNYNEFGNEFGDCIVDMKKEIERLNNIINKAIEYLESYNTDFKNCRFGEAPISIRELGDLFDILKGSE